MSLSSPKSAALRQRLVATIVLGATVNAAVLALVFTHPFGYPLSIGIAVAALLVLSVVLSRICRPFRSLEGEKLLAEAPDRLLKFTDDPNEPARWVP